MKKNMKHIKLFENFTGTRKILIRLSSSNSAGIPDRGPRTYNGFRDPNEGSSWSIGYPEKFDITELCQEIGEKTNEEYTKIVAGLDDLIKFRRDYEGFLDASIRNKERLKRKLKNILLNEPMEDINNKLPSAKKFKKLNLDDKITFYHDFIDMGFLCVRNSYIYKVIDENEFDSLCNEITYRLETLE